MRSSTFALIPGIACTAALAIGVPPALAATTAAAPEASPPAANGASPSPGAATITPAPGREQILLLDLDPSDIPADKVALLNGRIASLLARRTDLETLTAADIKAMATVDAERAAMGCDETSCLGEIASALGARYVIYGRVGRLDDLHFLQLNLFDAHVGRPVARQESQGGSLRDLSDQMPVLVRGLLEPLGGNDAMLEEPSDVVSPLAVTGGALAGAGVLLGGALGVWALGLEGDLNGTRASLAQKQFAYDWGAWVATGAIAGGVLALGGGALLAAGLTSE